MAGIKGRINRKSVAALQRGDWITDDSLPGFKARRPNRLVLYGLNIRLQGRMRWISLGSEADLTPDHARSEAERMRGLKRQGENPAAERDRRKGVVKVEAAVTDFLAEHVRPKLKARTAAHYDEMFTRLILPKFRSWRLDAVTQNDVTQWHLGMESTPIQANRALAILSSMMEWAKQGKKWCTDNPCVGVAHYRERKVLRYPTRTELAKIGRAIDELEAEGKLNLFFAAGARVLLMTGARRSEIFEAQWSFLDTERSELVLPDSKTDEKVIALPEAALEIILGLPRLADCKWIFPSTKTERPFVNFQAQWKPVLKRAGVGHWRLHDLRHGFASAAVNAGAPLYVVGRHLGHVRPTTTQRYAHVADDPKRAVVETVAGLFANGGGK
jgi:integrase